MLQHGKEVKFSTGGGGVKEKMTRETDITSDLDKTKTNQNSTMITVAIFDNADQQNKKKFVFDCSKEEMGSIINAAASNGVKWVASN